MRCSGPLPRDLSIALLHAIGRLLGYDSFRSLALGLASRLLSLIEPLFYWLTIDATSGNKTCANANPNAYAKKQSQPNGATPAYR
jgi:hypothetical protein